MSRMGGPSEWNGTAEPGRIYTMQEGEESRLGNGRIPKTVKPGCKLLCIEQSGDCFYEYRPLIERPGTRRTYPDGRKEAKYYLGKQFGAYQLGKKGRKLRSWKFHFLMARLDAWLPFVVMFFLFVVSAHAGAPASVYGKVQIVNAFPDYKVRVVDAFADLDVQVVNAFPDKPGKWEIVNSAARYKIQFVTIGEDFTVHFVNHSPAPKK